MFREVRLPEGVPGRLYLHSMPGRCEPFGKFVDETQRLCVKTVVRLTPLDEVERRSAEYAQALRGGGLPWQELAVDVPDYGVPEDRDAFVRLASEVARRLQQGARVLVHCGAGIGRTGTFAACVLIALGLDRAEAIRRVKAAGSWPETGDQEALVEWAADQLRLRSRPG